MSIRLLTRQANLSQSPTESKAWLSLSLLLLFQKLFRIIYYCLYILQPVLGLKYRKYYFIGMDKLIQHISSGVGASKRKRGKSAVLIRLGSRRQSDTLLSSDSSDDDYVPEEL